MRKLSFFAILIFTLALTTVSCKKDVNNSGIDQGTFPDLITKVSSAVSGFVTNEQDEPVYGATVKAGTSTTTTDKYGYFEFNNAMVVKEAAVVTVEYIGYFKGIKTYAVTEGKPVFFRIKLLPKTIAGTIQAGSGGTVTLSNGLSIAFPSGGIKNALTGALYSGTVQVAAQWIDPTSAELNNIMPGDLRGIDTDGYMKGLTTYGMAAVELTGAGGESLQIADGKKATLSFPLPTSINATAPSTIPLWYFDEQTGLWKEEGIATKTGDKYVGEVSHFSFWNCDVPANYVQFSCTILDNNNNPVPFANVKLSEISNPVNARWGTTNAAGYVSGLVPSNTSLKLELFSFGLCAVVVYSQNFNTGNIAYSAGNIIMPSLINSLANVSGSVTNCVNSPVTNGYVLVTVNNQFTRYYLNAQGAYNFSVFICVNPSPLTIFAVDADSLKESNIISYDLIPGVNSIPVIQACNIFRSIYDGKFIMNGIHNRPIFNFPYTNVYIEFVTSGLNEVAFYWPAAGSLGHPFATDANNTLSWYGPTIAPAIIFNRTTNEITDVYNMAGATPVSLYSGPIPTHNFFDSVNRKVYVAWQYNNNNLRAFFDTLTYIGPR